jgi:hypothetical protein
MSKYVKTGNLRWRVNFKLSRRNVYKRETFIANLYKDTRCQSVSYTLSSGYYKFYIIFDDAADEAEFILRESI